MICLDTNILISILRGDLKVKTIVEDIEAEGETMAVTPIILCELFKGAFSSNRQAEALSLVEEMASEFTLLEFNAAACKMFGKEHTRLARQGTPTQDSDLMIGCIAASHRAKLLTKNPKDFQNIQGLDVVPF